MNPKPKHRILIQWHITTNCNNRCRHCYMYDESTYANEKANTLPYSGLMKVLASINNFEQKWNCSIPVIAVSGGDPLQRKDWYKFISDLRASNKFVNIMCNPETLTQDTISLLKDAGIKRCQMSLDGLEFTHDYFRSAGSFRRTINKISELENQGVRSEIMFTLFPENKNDLFPLIRYLAADTPLSTFRFDIGTSAGNANNLSKDFNAREIKTILKDYLTLKDELKNRGRKLQLVQKVRLMELLHYERDNINRNHIDAPVTGGCTAGWYGACILSDGTVLSCRRLPLKAGKMPEQSFEEIFLGSELLKKLRRRKYYDGCGDCILYKSCRGCPAYVYGITGDPFSKYPLCFRKSDGIERALEFSEPGLDTTFEEEFNYITSSFQLDMNYISDQLWNDMDFRGIYLRLLDCRHEIEEFLFNPEIYVAKNDIDIDDYQLNTLYHYFRQILRRGLPENNSFIGMINKIKLRHLQN